MHNDLIQGCSSIGSPAARLCSPVTSYDTVKNPWPGPSFVASTIPSDGSQQIASSATGLPAVSVVIPSWNEARTLPGLLTSLQQQTVRDFEVILADSGSTDGTPQLADSFGIRWSAGERKGPAEGRNRGARLARAEVLVFVDADCILPPRVLEHILAALADRDVIGGATLFSPMAGTLPERLLFFLANAYQRATIAWGWPHNAGFCFFFRRSVFERIGGMREDLLLNETHDIALRSRRLGRFVSLPDVVATSMRRFRGNGFAKTVLHEYLGSTVLYYVTGRHPSAAFRPEPVR